jgi:gamma-glutamyl-gamma-aminobutyrate hydrolase PuuD
MILVINDYDGLYSKFWANLGGEVTHDPEILFRDPGSVKLVCFTGGEDVSPNLYGHENLGSYNSSARDAREVLIFEMAKKHKIPMTGICRGSQFLNVMCGGTMVQDLKESHGGGRHLCRTVEGKEFQVTSSHHQMSIPGKGGEVLAWAENMVGLDALTYDGDVHSALNAVSSVRSGFPEKRVVARITEAFCYPEFKIFGVQHHPEWQKIEEEAAQWTLNKIAEFCWGQEHRRERTMSEVAELLGK